MTVIGAGPSGLMVATIASQAGARVLLLEKLGWAGGRLGLQTQPLQGLKSIYQGYNGVDFCKRLLDDAVASGAEICLNACVTGITREPQGFTLGCGSDDNIHTKSTILASGSEEPGIEFPGSNLRGVMFSGDVQTRLNIYSELPGKRVVMIGSDNAGLLIAANLLDAGIQAPAVVDEAAQIVGREVNAAPLRDAGVEIIMSSRIVAAYGRDTVEAITIADKFSDDERTLEADTICMAGPRAPEATLAAQLGGSLSEHEVLGGAVPVHNRHMATPISGLYVCGDASGVENGAKALESGRLAGLSAAEDLGYVHPDAIAQEQLARARLGYLRRGRRGLLRRQAKAQLASEHERINRMA